MDMLGKQFIRYYGLLYESLGRPNFSDDNLAKLSAEYALKLLELEANVKLTQAEALKAIIQGESMKRSVRDNALIAKANSYVGFLNTMLNATAMANNKDGGATHSKNVVSTISEIDDSYLEGYDETLKELKSDILKITKLDDEDEEVETKN